MLSPLDQLRAIRAGKPFDTCLLETKLLRDTVVTPASFEDNNYGSVTDRLEELHQNSETQEDWYNAQAAKWDTRDPKGILYKDDGRGAAALQPLEWIRPHSSYYISSQNGRGSSYALASTMRLHNGSQARRTRPRAYRFAWQLDRPMLCRLRIAPQTAEERNASRPLNYFLEVPAAWSAAGVLRAADSFTYEEVLAAQGPIPEDARKREEYYEAFARAWVAFFDDPDYGFGSFAELLTKMRAIRTSPSGHGYFLCGLDPAPVVVDDGVAWFQEPNGTRYRMDETISLWRLPTCVWSPPAGQVRMTVSVNGVELDCEKHPFKQAVSQPSIGLAAIRDLPLRLFARDLPPEYQVEGSRVVGGLKYIYHKDVKAYVPGGSALNATWVFDGPRALTTTPCGLTACDTNFADVGDIKPKGDHFVGQLAQALGGLQLLEALLGECGLTPKGLLRWLAIPVPKRRKDNRMQGEFKKRIAKNQSYLAVMVLNTRSNGFMRGQLGQNFSKHIHAVPEFLQRAAFHAILKEALAICQPTDPAHRPHSPPAAAVQRALPEACKAGKAATAAAAAQADDEGDHGTSPAADEPAPASSKRSRKQVQFYQPPAPATPSPTKRQKPVAEAPVAGGSSGPAAPAGAPGEALPLHVKQADLEASGCAFQADMRRLAGLAAGGQLSAAGYARCWDAIAAEVRRVATKQKSAQHCGAYKQQVS